MPTSVKIVTFVPETHADIVRKAMGDAGAGLIGNYNNCSFSSVGFGRFTPTDGAKPTIGKVGQPQEVKEERIEVICSKEKAKQVIGSIRKVHPYEEPAIDIYPLFGEEEL